MADWPVLVASVWEASFSHAKPEWEHTHVSIEESIYIHDRFTVINLLIFAHCLYTLSHLWHLL